MGTNAWNVVMKWKLVGQMVLLVFIIPNLLIEIGAGLFLARPLFSRLKLNSIFCNMQIIKEVLV